MITRRKRVKGGRKKVIEFFGKSNFVLDKVIFAPQNIKNRSIKDFLLTPEEKRWNDFNYYVYIYHEPADNGIFGGRMSNGERFFIFGGAPFYVGKGTRKRCLDHIYQAKRNIKDPSREIKTPLLKKLKSILLENPNLESMDLVSVVAVFGTEDEAYEYETFLIKEFGSNFIKEIKDGPLMNMNLEPCKIASNNTKGENNGMSILKESDILEIYSLIKLGQSNKEIGEVFNVDSGHISSLRHGHRWKDLFAEYFKNGELNSPGQSKLSLNQKIDILQKIKNGYRNNALSKDYPHIDVSIFSNARHKKIWKDVWQLFNREELSLTG